MIELYSYFSVAKVKIKKWESTQIGSYIDYHSADRFPDLKNIDIAILSVPEYEGSSNNFHSDYCKFRGALYNLHLNNRSKIVDLGEIIIMPTRRETFTLIEKVFKELVSNNIVPVILGGGHDISYAVYRAYSSLEKFITFTNIDNKLDLGLENDKLGSNSHLGKIMAQKPSHLFHFTNLAHQSYFVSPLAINMIAAMQFDAVRLGELSNNFHEIEPLMRNTDFVSFDISSIQNSFAGANYYSTPNGLTGQQACKILNYAGLSDKVSAVGIFEYDQNLDVDNQTSILLAQMVWCFLDGFANRKKEINPDINQCIKYTVSFEDGKNEIVFYKSQSTGRWWMGVPFKSQSDEKIQNYFIACTYNDYEIANKGEVPERWIKTYNKFI